MPLTCRAIPCVSGAPRSLRESVARRAAHEKPRPRNRGRFGPYGLPSLGQAALFTLTRFAGTRSTACRLTGFSSISVSIPRSASPSIWSRRSMHCSMIAFRRSRRVMVPPPAAASASCRGPFRRDGRPAYKALRCRCRPGGDLPRCPSRSGFGPALPFHCLQQGSQLIGAVIGMFVISVAHFVTAWRRGAHGMQTPRDDCRASSTA